jgi:hypothetical protein
MLRRPGFAAVLALLLAAPAIGAPSRAYIVTTDFMTGGLSAINTTTFAAQNDVAAAHSDARVRWFRDKVYLINRLGADNIHPLNDTNFGSFLQFSTGNGSNPADIVFTGVHKAYVTRYELSSLLIVDPQNGATINTISLASFADADGIPEMDRMAMWGPWLFVSVQRLNRNAGFTPTDHSVVVVIDTRTDTVHDVDPGTPGVQGITLPAKNPVTAFAFDRAGRKLLLGCAGFYGALDGGIVAIDPETHQSLGVLASEPALGGELSDVEWYTATRSFAIVSDLAFNTKLIRWNPTTGAATGTIFNPGGFTLPDCALDGTGRLWLCHNDFTNPGVRVYDCDTDALLAGPIDTGLPPYQIAFDEQRPEVGAPPASQAARLNAWPNPACSSVQLALGLGTSQLSRVEIFDPAGRRVRTLPIAPHATSLEWDLRDESGNRVRPGLYMLSVRTSGQYLTRRLSVVD